jgi:hypothetical protein
MAGTAYAKLIRTGRGPLAGCRQILELSRGSQHTDESPAEFTVDACHGRMIRCTSSHPAANRPNPIPGAKGAYIHASQL